MDLFLHHLQIDAERLHGDELVARRREATRDKSGESLHSLVLQFLVEVLHDHDLA